MRRLPIIEHIVFIIAICVFVAACGGGGGGSAGNGGSGGIGGSGGSGSTERFGITENNLPDLGALALYGVETLQVVAENMISAATIVQLVEQFPIDLQCAGGTDSATIDLLDNDGNAMLSVGDAVVLDYAGCFGITGDISLNIVALTQSGRIFDELTGSVETSLTFAGIPQLTSMEIRHDIDFLASDDEIRWHLTNGSYAENYAAGSARVHSAVIVKSIFAATGKYDISISGEADLFGDEYSFATTSSFRGPVGTYPELGVLVLTAATSTGDVLPSNDYQRRPEQARFRVDESGDGQYGDMRGIDWSEFLGGAVFGIEEGAEVVLPERAIDLMSRSFTLGGSIGDATFDEQRNVIYFSLTDRNEIAVVDGTSFEVLDRIFVGAGPESLDLSESGGSLYVGLAQSGDIAVIDLESGGLETVSVAAALGTVIVSDIVESSPGVVFATGNSVASDSYVVRVDRNAGNAVSRVADQVTVPGVAGLSFDPVNNWVYVTHVQPILRLDNSVPEAPIVLSGSDLDVHQTVATVSRDGTQLYTDSGDVLNSETLARIGKVNPGQPYPLPGSAELAVLDQSFIGAPFNLEIYSTRQFDLFDRITIDCDLSTALRGYFQLAENGWWLFYSEDGACVVDVYSPDAPPGSDDTAGGEPPAVPRISVSGVQSDAFGSTSSVVYDPARSLIFVVSPSDARITSYSSNTLEIVDEYSVVGGQPEVMDLDPTGNEIVVGFRDTGSLGFLDLDSGFVETIELNPALQISAISDVEYVDMDSVFLSAVSGATFSSHIVRAARSNTPAAEIVVPEIASDFELRVVADRAAALMYVHDNASATRRLYVIDLAQSSTPIVASRPDTEIRGPWTMELSPDGSMVALVTGVIISANDLTQRAVIEAGASAFSGDSRSVAVAQDVGHLHIYSTETFTKSVTVETGCGESAVDKILALPESNAWLLKVGHGLCLVQMPPQSLQLNMGVKQQEQPSGYYCDAECLSRRYAQPALRRYGVVPRRPSGR